MRCAWGHRKRIENVSLQPTGFTARPAAPLTLGGSTNFLNQAILLFRQSASASSRFRCSSPDLNPVTSRKSDRPTPVLLAWVAKVEASVNKHEPYSSNAVWRTAIADLLRCIRVGAQSSTSLSRTVLPSEARPLKWLWNASSKTSLHKRSNGCFGTQSSTSFQALGTLLSFTLTLLSPFFLGPPRLGAGRRFARATAFWAAFSWGALVLSRLVTSRCCFKVAGVRRLSNLNGLRTEDKLTRDVVCARHHRSRSLKSLAVRVSCKPTRFQERQASKRRRTKVALFPEVLLPSLLRRSFNFATVSLSSSACPHVLAGPQQLTTAWVCISMSTSLCQKITISKSICVCVLLMSHVCAFGYICVYIYMYYVYGLDLCVCVYAHMFT